MCIHAPASHGHSCGWNVATDESWTERVVILSPQPIKSEGWSQEGLGVMSDASSLHDQLCEQALWARRKMLSDGTLLPEDVFRARLRVGEKQFRELLEAGSIFGMKVDGHVYYPRELADPRHNHTRLEEVCRIIVPAGDARLDFLKSRRASLGERSPVEMLNADADYARLLWVAQAWATEFSRTIVKLFDGTHEKEPSNVDPLYTCMAEIDPRKAIWERASAALHMHGYQWPLGPYPDARHFTAFVGHRNADDTEPRPDACVQIVVDGELIRIRVIFKEGIERYSEALPVGRFGSVVDVAKKIVTHLLRR